MKAWAVAMVVIVAACGLYVAWMAYDSVDKTTGAVMADQEAMTASWGEYYWLAKKYPVKR